MDFFLFSSQLEMLDNDLKELKRLASLGEGHGMVQKEFVHVRVNVSGSPLEFLGALMRANFVFVVMPVRLFLVA